MDRSRGSIGLTWASLLLLSGCVASPWTNSAPPSAITAADPPVAEAAPGPSQAGTSPAQSPAPPGQTSAASPTHHAPPGQTGPAAPEPQELQAMMVELQQLGALDPEAQQVLMEDLRQTEPAMWKPVMERFRAALAYRRRMEERKRSDPEASEPPSSDPRAPGWSQAGEEGQEPAEEEIVLGPKDTPVSGGKRASDPLSRPEPPRAKSVKRLPAPTGRAAAKDAAGQPRSDSHEKQPERNSQDKPAADGHAAEGHAAADPAKAPKDADTDVVQAGHAVPADMTWQDRLTAAIRGLEAEVSPAPKTDEEIARHVQLRLLCLAAGRREDAMKPIPGVPPAMQDFWASEVYGLQTLLDDKRTPDRRDRAAEAKRLLGDAAAKLSVAAPLVVKGLAFATEVQSFGCYTRFEKDEFLPDQEVLLYAEVENFKSESTPKGFQTSLRSSYKVFDSRGQQVAEQEFPVTEELCRSERRDFFIGYHLRMPKDIYPGKHTLKLTIEDLKRGEVSQASIDFSVRAAKG